MFRHVSQHDLPLSCQDKRVNRRSMRNRGIKRDVSIVPNRKEIQSDRSLNCKHRPNVDQDEPDIDDKNNYLFFGTRAKDNNKGIEKAEKELEEEYNYNCKIRNCECSTTEDEDDANNLSQGPVINEAWNTEYLEKDEEPVYETQRQYDEIGVQTDISMKTLFPNLLHVKTDNERDMDEITNEIIAQEENGKYRLKELYTQENYKARHLKLKIESPKMELIEKQVAHVSIQCSDTEANKHSIICETCQGKNPWNLKNYEERVTKLLIIAGILLATFCAIFVSTKLLALFSCCYSSISKFYLKEEVPDTLINRLFKILNKYVFHSGERAQHSRRNV